LASGTPVLTADRGGVAETVGRSGAGAHFQSGDRGALVEAVAVLMSSNLSTLSARGRAYVEAHHGWDLVLDRLFSIYRDVLRN
jgi:glycosyltransferase involved in cell wall biosynthesis